jgi:N-acetylmuramic acid 6-phosphate etherase
VKSLPPDRSHVGTERRHGASSDFDARDTPSAVALMVEDHAAVIDAARQGAASIAEFIEALVPRVRDGGRLIYIGAGTSGRLGVLDASECPPTFQSEPGRVVGIIAGGDAALRRSSEGREDDPRGGEPEFDALGINQRDTVLGIAAGGTTPYVLGAIRFAKERGAMTGLLTCAAREAPPACDHLIVLNTGPEILTGSTRLKAGSATKLALNIITTVMFTKLGKVYGNLMVDLRATNDKLVDRAIRIVCAACPELSREQAAELLERGGREVKTAIVMARCGMDAAAARAALAAANGRLRTVIS